MALSGASSLEKNGSSSPLATEFDRLTVSDARPCRLLALGGTGSQGLSQLLILQGLMEAIDSTNPPKPCDYFDLIGGASTGGLMAIMLGRLQMSVKATIAAFEILAEKCFVLSRRLPGDTKEEELARQVKGLLRRANERDNATMKMAASSRCKVFVVCASRTDQPTLLRSYPLPSENSEECTVWEAARATMAINPLFLPVTLSSGLVAGAGLGTWNCVEEQILLEAARIWPGVEVRSKCLVSVNLPLPSNKPDPKTGVPEGLPLRVEPAYQASWNRAFWSSAEARDLENFGSLYAFYHSHPRPIPWGAQALKPGAVAEISRSVEMYLSLPETRLQLRGCAGKLRPKLPAGQDPLDLLSSSPIPGGGGVSTTQAARNPTLPNAASYATPTIASAADKTLDPSMNKTSSQPRDPATIQEKNHGVGEPVLPTHHPEPEPLFHADRPPPPVTLSPAEKRFLRREPNLSDPENADEALLAAAGKGFKNILQKAIDNGGSVHTRDNMNRTPLHIAAQAGELDCLRSLLERGAVINARDRFGETPLIRASRASQSSTALELLYHPRVDTDIVDTMGWTALGWAVYKGAGSIVESLLQDAWVQLDEDPARSPLWWARLRSHEHVVRMVEAAAARTDAPIKRTLTKGLDDFDPSKKPFSRVPTLEVPVEINGQTFKAMILTAAESSLMSVPCAHAADIFKLIDKRFAGTVRGTGSNPHMGRIHVVPVDVAGISARLSLTVMTQAELNWEVLLGIDFFRRCGAVIEFGPNILRIKNPQDSLSPYVAVPMYNTMGLLER